MKNLRLLMLLVLALPAASLAEKADREQKARISAMRSTQEGPESAKTFALEGDVEVTQGTLRITAERAVFKNSPETRTIELFGAGDKPVTFRQKREGETTYIEAWADRGFYDEDKETVKLYKNVRFKSAGDTMQGEYMQYHTGTEKLELRNRLPNEPASPAPAKGDDRVVIEVMPHPKSVKKP